MRYVFMDNYRGFSETVIPLRQVSFLVGENSTGKSSFLSLLYLLSSPDFSFTHDFSAVDFCDLGGFNDIVSAGSSRQTHFTIGALSTGSKKDDHSRYCKVELLTFRNDDGLPRLERYVRYFEGNVLKVVYSKKATLYKIFSQVVQYTQESDFVEFIVEMFRADKVDSEGFKKVPKDIANAPIPFLISMLESTDSPERQKKKDQITFKLSTTPLPVNLTWLAPIRTKPKRTYDGFRTNFTPEGAHTPHIIRKTLESKDKAKRFTSLMKEFGESSGLFRSVKAHSFGKDHSSPFEVIIELAAQPLNISDVGYGVSQVLPVVVEMLTKPKDSWFAIQQPEVHLHPKAQAALGDLIHLLVQEKGQRYIVETHSDYLIDRFRLRMKETGVPKSAQVVFFERTDSGNKAYALQLTEKGQYPEKQPNGFREFFIREEMKMLDI